MTMENEEKDQDPRSPEKPDQANLQKGAICSGNATDKISRSNLHIRLDQCRPLERTSVGHYNRLACDSSLLYSWLSKTNGYTKLKAASDYGKVIRTVYLNVSDDFFETIGKPKMRTCHVEANNCEPLCCNDEFAKCSCSATTYDKVSGNENMNSDAVLFPSSKRVSVCTENTNKDSCKAGGEPDCCLQHRKLESCTDVMECRDSINDMKNGDAKYEDNTLEGCPYPCLHAFTFKLIGTEVHSHETSRGPSETQVVSCPLEKDLAPAKLEKGGFKCCFEGQNIHNSLSHSSMSQNDAAVLDVCAVPLPDVAQATDETKMLKSEAIVIHEESTKLTSQSDSVEGQDNSFHAATDGLVSKTRVSIDGLPMPEPQASAVSSNRNAFTSARDRFKGENDSLDLFEPPSFMTLVEPGVPANSTYESKRTAKTQQIISFPSVPEFAFESPKRNATPDCTSREVFAGSDNWSPGRQEVQLKALLYDTKTETKDTVRRARDHSMSPTSSRDGTTVTSPRYFADDVLHVSKADETLSVMSEKRISLSESDVQAVCAHRVQQRKCSPLVSQTVCQSPKKNASPIRQHEAVIATGANRSPEKSLVPLRTLLHEAKLESMRRARKERNHSSSPTAKTGRGSAGERRKPKGPSSRMVNGNGNGRIAEAGQKELKSPARLPIVRKHGAGSRLQWKPFICCPAVN